MQPTLFDLPTCRPTDFVYADCPPAHTIPANPAEDAAAAAAVRFTRSLRVEVLAMIRDAGPDGLTAKEAVAVYRRAHRRSTASESELRNAIAPRMTELSQAAFVRQDHNQPRRQRCAPFVAIPGRNDEDGSLCKRAMLQGRG